MDPTRRRDTGVTWEQTTKKLDRREVLALGMAGVFVGGTAHAQPTDGALTAAEREAIRWGETEDGVQAGLRLLNPKAVYRPGDHVELAAYLRNRTSAALGLTYYCSFAEKTPAVVGPDGKPARVGGVNQLSLVATVLQATLAPGETLLLEHPGFWLENDASPAAKGPSLWDPQPGRHRISQTVPFGPRVPTRHPVHRRAVTFYSPAGTPRRGEAVFIVLQRGDVEQELATGAVEITVG